jgi:nitrate reductase (cytochrome), electron transfer subunit
MSTRRAVRTLAGIVAATLLVVGANQRLEQYRQSRPQPDAGAALPVLSYAADGRGPDGRVQAGPDIAAEALVFRTRAEDVAANAGRVRRVDAHPRTLATFRSLRAYPGAPPRVPHGLTATELGRSICNTCHERGGYSARFGAYVPLTPHPELDGCLQCHAIDATLVDTPVPDGRADAVCRQCHRPARQTELGPGIAWQPAAWPAVRSASEAGAPPEIPHDLQQRGNCLACHMGPGAVAEIRTTHPERTDCRQCHVAPFDDHSIAGDNAPFTGRP